SEIARRQEVPAGTVRWRLKTGLDRVRAELDRRYAAPRWRGLLVPLAPRGRGPVPWKAIMATKATTKGAMLVVAILLALLGARQLHRTQDPRSMTADAAARAPHDPRGARAPDGPRALGLYRPGARTNLPRFRVAPVADAGAAPRLAGAPPRLDRSGDGPRSHLEHPPPKLKEIQARLRAKLDEMNEKADPCLTGWTAPDPALRKGVMLGLDLDAGGLQSVWVA